MTTEPSNESQLTQELAGLADLCAFWKYQAMWHYAQLNSLDIEDTSTWKNIERVFEHGRREENKERYSHAEPPRDIGS